MAANTKKRDIVKYTRDGIKQNYKKQKHCAICSSNQNLELHHYHSVKLVVDQFISTNNLPEPETEDECISIRESIYKEQWYELVEDTVTLCQEHHKELHRIYGVTPLLNTAEAQKTWVLKRNAKASQLPGITPSQLPGITPVSEGRFSRFKC